MLAFLEEFKKNIRGVISSLRDDINTIRTGRANPALVESLVVEAYNGTTKLRLLELATITTEGSSALVIVPFDSSITGDIEKAILQSSLGLAPSTQGSKILVKIPPLSQEQREKMMKIIGQKIEEKKTAIRNHRDDIRRKLKVQVEKKEITKDDKFRTEKEIDNMTQNTMDEVQLIKDAKEKEIMEV